MKVTWLGGHFHLTLVLEKDKLHPLRGTSHNCC